MLMLAAVVDSLIVHRAIPQADRNIKFSMNQTRGSKIPQKDKMLIQKSVLKV